MVGSPSDSFGEALAIGLLDDDRDADLVVGGSDARIGSQAAAGGVTLLKGGPRGLTTKGYGGVRLSQATAGIAGTARRNDHFGETLAIAAVQGRTEPNVIIGAPGETRDGVASVGQIHQLAVAPNGSGPSTRAASRCISAAPASRASHPSGRALGPRSADAHDQHLDRQPRPNQGVPHRARSAPLTVHAACSLSP